MYLYSSQPKSSLRLGSFLTLFHLEPADIFLTDPLLLLLSYLSSCQKSILQGPGRQGVKAFHYGRFRDQPREHTERTLVAIVSFTKTPRGKEKSQNDENQCFHFNRMDTQQAHLSRELQPLDLFHFFRIQWRVFDLSFSKWSLGAFSTTMSFSHRFVISTVAMKEKDIFDNK